MTQDVLPDRSNKIAWWIGRIIHPMIIPAPTLLILLSDLPIGEALVWTALIVFIIMTPGIIAIAYFQRRNQFVYQRMTRLPLYIVAWLSVALCYIVLLMSNSPPILQLCMLALLIWLPAQLLINQYLTKISAHTAVFMGCVSGLFMTGYINTPIEYMLVAMTLIMLIWARITTRNHTLIQTLLGVIVSGSIVISVFYIGLGF